MQRSLLTLLLVILLLPGCFKKENDCAPRNVEAPAVEIKAVEDYLQSQSIAASKHSSGLYYQIIQQGTGKAPEICSDVRVGFSGYHTSGNVFETNAGEVLSLRLMLEAWRIGLPLINAGGRIKLYVPPRLAYGATGKKDPNSDNMLVPPSAPVIMYDITLYEVK